MIAQIVSMKSDVIELFVHPGQDEPRPGDIIEILESEGEGLIAQVIDISSAGYSGAGEAALQEVLELAAAERHTLINREPGLADLKKIKAATAKIRRRVHGGQWLPWDGRITARNAALRRVPVHELVERLSGLAAHPITVGEVSRADGAESETFTFEARCLDKLNVIVGNKGFGKSHTGKVVLMQLVGLGAPCVVFDVNEEYVGLPGAEVASIGVDYALPLAEVGFGTLMSVIDSVFPMTETARANLDYYGPRFIDEQRKARGYATLDYLIKKADAGDFGGGDLVGRAIGERLTKVKGMGLFANGPTKVSIMKTLMTMGEHGGLLVFDLSTLKPRVRKGVVAGLNRIVERFCEDEKRGGTKRYPFVFYEEAHLYIDEDDILNIVTRMRHLGMTTTFITNRPELLPKAVMGLVDNLFMLNLASHADVKAVAKSVLTDEATLESFAVALPPHHALIVGTVTGRFPLIVKVGALPEGTPATGVTQSFWDRVA